MHNPCLEDLLTCEENNIPTREIAFKLLYEVEFMLNQISFDYDLNVKNSDISSLHLRKANILKPRGWL